MALACKTFSTTKSKDRDELGDKVTEWIRRNRIEPIDTHVLQSSDDAFHCFTIVVFYNAP